MTPFGVPFRLDFCQRTVHCRPPGTDAPNSTFAKTPLPKHLNPGRQRPSFFTSTFANAPIENVPPFSVAGWSHDGTPKPAKAPVVKKFAFAHEFVASTLMSPRAKKASWFDPW